MNRTLIIPVSIAAALHAGVLFGFPRGKVPAKPARPSDKIEVIEMRPPVEPPDLVVPRDVGDTAKPMARPVITGVDNSVPDKNGFKLEIPDLTPVVLKHVERIEPGVIGVPGGTGDDFKNAITGIIGLDNPPRTRSQIPPPYPFEAKSRGIGGRVLVEFIVDEGGRVTDPRIVESTDRMFEEPTLRAIAKWRFEPGRRHGQIVRFRMALPVDFNLNEN